jgi:von Hippel-Lindau disease tumor supressor
VKVKRSKFAIMVDEANRGGDRRAGRSLIYSFVRFINKTLRRVDIVWLNYEGARVKYKTIQPEQFVDVNTFVGHPWIFRDADSGDRLVVHLHEIFQPLGWSSADGWPPQRKVVNISIPGNVYFIYFVVCL